MLYQSTYYGIMDMERGLKHHGIKGQKWGVRRFQNPDGTYTEAGKLRRNKLSDKFDAAEKAVLATSSIKTKAIRKEPIDLTAVKQRGNLTDKEAKECADLANTIYKQAASIEPRITKSMISAVSSAGASMYGLEHRLKTPTSIAAKIGADAKESKSSFLSSALSLKDTIRYTTISSEEKFVSTYNSIKKSLEKSGYKEIRCKNYYDAYKQGRVMHKAVQSVFENQNGDKFEVQFHTPSSQAAKELKLPIYEERRKANVRASRQAELDQEMRDLAEHVKDPKRVMTIRSH